MDTGFGKSTSRTITGENLSKIGSAGLEILIIFGFWACPGKSTPKSGNYENFFSNAPNGSIRKVNHLKRFPNTFKIFWPTTGC